MSENIIQELREALKFSPDNIPLRMLLAETLLGLNQFEEAEVEYLHIIRISNDVKARIGLAKVYFKKGSYSACNVILEELLDDGVEDVDLYVLYAKGLIQEKEFGKAQEVYRLVLSKYPDFSDEELDEQLRIKTSFSFEDEEELYSYDDRFLSKPDLNFDDVAGMELVKKEIDLKIIKPLLHPEIYKAYGKKSGGGILLFGPPGCGKTYIAKATAGQINAKFISIELNDILDMWIGNSEKNLHDIFELARNNTPCVLFIDEVDALGASRTDMKTSSSRTVINQFLQELDGINANNEGILVMAATNTPWNLDPAFRRPGRFDRIIFIPPPDQSTRESLFKIKLSKKPITTIDYTSLAKKSEHYSGADIDAVIDMAVEMKIESSIETGVPQPIENKDLLAALKKHKPSTQEWFSVAKNYAMFANDSGLYDEILSYLKIKK